MKTLLLITFIIKQIASAPVSSPLMNVVINFYSNQPSTGEAPTVNNTSPTHGIDSTVPVVSPEHNVTKTVTIKFEIEESYPIHEAKELQENDDQSNNYKEATIINVGSQVITNEDIITDVTKTIPGSNDTVKERFVMDESVPLNTVKTVPSATLGTEVKDLLNRDITPEATDTSHAEKVEIVNREPHSIDTREQKTKIDDEFVLVDLKDDTEVTVGDLAPKSDAVEEFILKLEYIPDEIFDSTADADGVSSPDDSTPKTKI